VSRSFGNPWIAAVDVKIVRPAGLEEVHPGIFTRTISMANVHEPFQAHGRYKFFVFYLTNETDEPERYFALFDVDEDELEV